eukprot:1328746-Rhodomonas_salina.2
MDEDKSTMLDRLYSPPSSYAMPGTDLGYDARQSVCPPFLLRDARKPVSWCGKRAIDLGYDARNATCAPYLATHLLQSYAKSGTKLGYAANRHTRLDPGRWLKKRFFDEAGPHMVLRARYEISGTNIS